MLRTDLPCRVEGCSRMATASKGYCWTHYQRWRRHGRADIQLPIDLTAEERFWRLVDRRDPDECWPWRGSVKPNGYGNTANTEAGGNTQAHRRAYELAVSPIPPGYHLDHLCHSRMRDECRSGNRCPHRRCCNPAHLEAVPPVVNALRARFVICGQGHVRDESDGSVTSFGCRVCHREYEWLRRRGIPWDRRREFFG